MPAAVAAGAEDAALRIAQAGMIDRADRDVAAGGERRGEEDGQDEHSHEGTIGGPAPPYQKPCRSRSSARRRRSGSL